MKMDNVIIKTAFPKKAWAYYEGLDSIKIGKWNGSELIFAEPLSKDYLDYLTELRVFDDKRELRFTGKKCRDTADYCEYNFIAELANAQYFMYGEQAVQKDDCTALSEISGGTIVFPVKLEFPKTSILPDGVIGLKLGIRNYVRYNDVPVLPKGEKYDYGLHPDGEGAIEVVDYAYTGFFYANGEKVAL